MKPRENKFVNIEAHNGHNRQVSIAKAIGIILMVMGHSGCPEYLHNFIYLFHMPLFYFLSAYFFRDEKVVGNGGGYVLRKFKNLYWPYVKWSLIFLLLHNVFSRIGFYDYSLSWQEIYVNAKRAVRGMWQGERMLGAYWFLISLFWESLLFGAVIWMKHKLRCRYFDLAAVILLFFAGYYAPIDFGVNRELVLLPIFYAGYLSAKRKMDLSTRSLHQKTALLLSALLLICLALFVRIEVGQSEFGNPILFLLGSFAGIYLVMAASDLLGRTLVGKWLDALGGVTMTVLTFHFLSFKVLTLLLVSVGVYSRNVLFQWPVPVDHAYNYLWGLYTVVGVLVPFFFSLLIGWFYKLPPYKENC